MTNLEENITNAKSEEEILQIFSDAGIRLTAEQLHMATTNTDGELSEDIMDGISGGFINCWPIVRSWFIRRNASGGGGDGAFGGGGSIGGR